MSTIKTATTALTAVFLVTGIGLAVAQSEDVQRADPPTQANASSTVVISEQTPADPNAVLMADAQQKPIEETARATEPATLAVTPSDPVSPAQDNLSSNSSNSYSATGSTANSAAMNGNNGNTSNLNNSTSTTTGVYGTDTAATANLPAATTVTEPSYEPAPRADRN